jgi:Holliday junction resolvase RusA-like endonuclease
VSANDRDHWRVKARKVAEIRNVAEIYVWNRGMPAGLDHITVGLVYVPRDRRRRDADNLVVPLMKALVDGIVDAGVVADDDTEHVTRTMPVILAPDGDPRLVLIIAEGRP